ncbi:hypothetical protein GCM10027170_11830 [Aliiglaciecola aliphaticivorans]
MYNGLYLADIGFSQFNYFSDVDNVYVTKCGSYPCENKNELFAYRLDLKYEVDWDTSPNWEISNEVAFTFIMITF